MDKMTTQGLIEDMSRILNTDPEELLGKSRRQPLPMARFLLCSTFCGSQMAMTTGEAGALLGQRDHATVLHGIKQVAIVRQGFGTREERSLLQQWDRHINTINNRKQREDMQLNNIKYRGRVDDDSWVHGQDISISDGVITIGGRYIQPNTLGMFTGMTGETRKKEKKREIYDGDVVTRKGLAGNYLVRFDQKRAAFRLIPTIHDGPKDGQPAYMNASENYVVIGNMHDDRALGLAYSETYTELQDRETEHNQEEQQ